MIGITTLLGSLITAGAEGWKSWQKRKAEEVDAKHQLSLAKINAKTAKFVAKQALREKRMDQDHDYDLVVLQNRKDTWIDEIIIIVWIVVYAMHFVPFTQPFMAAGWATMGYVGVPWWFEFGWIGILISTLGLRGVFRDWINRWGASRAK